MLLLPTDVDAIRPSLYDRGSDTRSGSAVVVMVVVIEDEDNGCGDRDGWAGYDDIGDKGQPVEADTAKVNGAENNVDAGTTEQAEDSDVDAGVDADAVAVAAVIVISRLLGEVDVRDER